MARIEKQTRKPQKMRFNVYGRYELEVTRDGDRWSVHRLDGDKRRPADLAIPPDLPADGVATYLDDLLHEAARPGDSIQRLS